MTLNLYVMPIIGTRATRQDSRRPKYASTITAAGFGYAMYDYGDEPTCLAGVVDITPALDPALSANADVVAVPQNLDLTVGAVNTRNTLRTHLEANEIPGTWVQTSTTYRQIVQVVGACCQFAQRYQGLGAGPWFSGTVNVSSTFSALTQSQQNGTIATAQSFGFTTAVIAGPATIRDVLKDMADQYIASNLPLVMANISLYTSQPA